MRIEPPLRAHEPEAAAGVRVFRWRSGTLPKGGVPDLFLGMRFVKRTSGFFLSAIALIPLGLALQRG